MMPKRIQRKRTKGWRMPSNTVSVCRPSRYGNPFRVGMFANYDAADAVRDFRRWIDREHRVRSFEYAFGPPPTLAEIQRDLKGKNLACWCPIGQPCHGDVLLELANLDTEKEAA